MGGWPICAFMGDLMDGGWFWGRFNKSVSDKIYRENPMRSNLSL
jgi:hypothetical protein